MSLNAHERETVIVFNDAEEMAEITTHQRPIITKLRKNPAARELEDLTFERTAGARFELPKELVSFRSVRRRQELTEEQRKERAARLRAAVS